ncbi:solute carrier organic anion transporter family member 1C1-like [Colossoma macropomum]|uniref:solute carrier organic anion transporter family member 1C1-like n=1 Tax=Colossoma macropomum TaxID=42526 RepID=UPI001864A129|nr:solute carrier organic anion transporter family member 1C1-like [Colossoma macropomum]
MTVESRPEGFSEPHPLHAANDPKPQPAAKCCSPSLKMFICVLAFCNFSKSLSGSYTKSTITQIERRFDIPSSVVGIIDGSFEMGNLLVITVVSYFGAKFHRPRIIGAGVLLMAMGTLLMALPHFLMGQYEYGTVAFPVNDADNFIVTSPCSASSQNITQQHTAGCDKGEEEGSPMWIILLLGNVIRGIGEATVGPLGMAFIDDYARPENSAFYIGCLHTISVIGPLFGYSLGSLCANLYVDIGFVNMESVFITPQDSRWVGAWWLGYLVAGALSLLSALPFWFLPSALPEVPQPAGPDTSSGQPAHTCPEQTTVSLAEIAKDFVPSLKRLLTNKIYVLYLIFNALIFNGFVIIITYTPKYFEQQFGQSASRANFLLGITSIPATCLGIFLSGVIMKRFKLDLLGAARLSFVTYIAGFLCTVPYFALSCSNTDVAGVTVPYQRSALAGDVEVSLVSSCNAGCGCSLNQWDPVCGQNGVTYVSACYAGCSSTHGSGMNTNFHDCRCVQSWGVSEVNSTAVLGQCSRESSCSTMFYIYLALQSLSFFLLCLGSVPLFLICLRSVEPELKSLSAGMFLLVLRLMGGIPAPIYFGALIDSTCLKWGSRKCGGRGACRIYDTQTFRFLFLGLISGLRVCGYVLFWITVVQIKKKLQKDKQTAANLELQKPAGGAAEALLKEDTE